VPDVGTCRLRVQAPEVLQRHLHFREASDLEWSTIVRQLGGPQDIVFNFVRQGQFDFPNSTRPGENIAEQPTRRARGRSRRAGKRICAKSKAT